MKRFLLALALGGALPLSPVVAQAAPASSPAASGVAAEVNGDKIQMSDLNRVVDSFKADNPKLADNTPEAQKALSDIRTQVLDELITTKLLSQEARRQKFTPQPKEVDAALTTLRTTNFKTDADFQTWLKTDGKSLQDVRGVIGDELAIRAYSTNLTRDVVVSPQDISDYYRAHLDQFTVPEGVKAHHILLAVNPNASQADKDAVMKRAQTLIKQLKANPSSFETLAKTNSDDPASKDNGGALDPFPRGEMIQSFEDAAFSAKPGEISGPITTEFGVDILRVDEKIPSKVLTLSEVQDDPQLKALLLRQKVQARLDEQIAKLRAAANIKKNI